MIIIFIWERPIRFRPNLSWRRDAAAAPAETRPGRDKSGERVQSKVNSGKTFGMRKSEWIRELYACRLRQRRKAHWTDREKGVPRDTRQTVWARSGLGKGIVWHLYLYLLRQPVDSYINLRGDDCFRNCWGSLHSATQFRERGCKARGLTVICWLFRYTEVKKTY